MKIALFGGTFNPFHIGHYEMLSEICKLDYIDKVLVLPTKIPPHKVLDTVVSDEDRINMCELACFDFDKAQLCLAEFEREGKSYTADTVKQLKTVYPNAEFYIAIGGDMANTLTSWYDTEYLFKNASFLAFCRSDEKIFNESISDLKAQNVNITVIDKKIPDVSSSKLRKKLNKKLLPERIYDYITEKGLYNEEN
ncbi:MAG: nicotinate (nicotinamide) nucleotide adenylyltransferase [Clostridia bacterium]|nr:nicotinate (nicotinamide) nucleotide adenylyltransferase [Clostridia bacterium]